MESIQLYSDEKSRLGKGCEQMICQRMLLRSTIFLKRKGDKCIMDVVIVANS